MSLADEWHDPRGPEPLPVKPVDAQDALDFIWRGFTAALDARTEAYARAAGIDEATIDLILRRSTSQA